MKTALKITVLTASVVVMLVLDFEVPPGMPLQVQMVPQAHAILGVRRRAFRRGAIIGASEAEASAKKQQQEQQQQQKQQQQQQHQAAPAAPAHAAPAAASAPAAATGKPLPLGTVVHALPGGCTQTPVGGVQYYYCGGNFYRAVFQGNQLVYVTAKP
jgi:pyruvate/2-oxoglutarate dehydrogenase complex dihydrolipoamide acyltransferase (E2) component